VTTGTLLHDLLDHRAAATPDATGLTWDGRSWSYAQLASRSAAAARWLSRLGVSRGDRVVVIARNNADLVPLIFGISRLGAIFVLLSDQIRARHLEHIVADTGPAVVIVKRHGAASACSLAGIQVRDLDDLRHALARPAQADPVRGADPDPPSCLSIDPVSLIYTSGSTAFPKGVVSTHQQVLFATEAIQSRLEYRPEDAVFCCLPLSFDYGLYQIFLTCAAGARLVLGDDSDAGPALLGRLAAEDISVLPLIPSLAATFCRLVGRAGQPPGRLRMITNTGAELTTAACAQLRSAVPGIAVTAMFGLTECKRISIAEPNLDLTRPGSVGRPLPDTEVAVVGEDGRPLPPDEVGELIVRGPHVMAGYWRAPELTAARFRRDAIGQPVLYTGDLCRIDKDGYLYFVGRNDDVYKQHGRRVSTTEIEAAAMDVPGVELAAALPPDRGHGSRLGVTGELTVRRLVSELLGRLEPEQMPAECRVLPALPLTINGKIDKRALAGQWAAYPPDAAPATAWVPAGARS